MQKNLESGKKGAEITNPNQKKKSKPTTSTHEIRSSSENTLYTSNNQTNLNLTTKSPLRRQLTKTFNAVCSLTWTTCYLSAIHQSNT